MEGLREEVSLGWADSSREAVDTPSIPEGVLCLPESLVEQGVGRDRAIWLIPSGKFQKDAWS